ncbi:MAG TPA: hypothetical protein VFL38_14080 [Humibacillus xanthopallidus]|nr:hypothetical protein [Humibacillus xanthopallidus]
MTRVTGALRPASTAGTDEQRLAAVTAPVRDPLWFLARQLQTRGFVADDGGSPVTVAVGRSTTPLTVDGKPVTAPLEPDVEAEPPTPRDRIDTATRIRLATELFRRVVDGGVPPATVATLRAGLAAAYPLRAVLAGNPAGPVAQALPDPVALYAAWAAAVGAAGTTGTLPPLPGAGTSRALIEVAARSWVGWMTARLGPVGGPTAPPKWDGTTLAYAFSATGRVGSATLTLTAPDYDGEGLDWHSFDRSALASAPPAGPPAAVRPSPVTYPGMPERGFWTMEDGTVNLDVLAGQDPSRQLLVSFAHGFGNDWFVVPLTLDSGATLITSLTVTDSFGTVTPVLPAAALDGPAARFRLWELTAASATTDAGVGMRVLLPGSPPPLQGPSTEEVLLARDEMANLGWLIELATTDEDGAKVDRYRRWLSLRSERDPAFTPGSAGDTLYYRLGTSLPDYWYPLMSTGAGLALAAVPPGATDVSSEGVTGTIVPHVPGSTVKDEEVPRAGTAVSRVHRLVQTPAGRRVWRARRRTAGTGEASSGLRFDTLGAPAVTPNLLSNPALALASRTAAAAAVSKVGRSPSLGRDWQVVNPKGGRTEARLEPSTRGQEGWQLHIVANKPKSGVAQTFATKTTAPAAAEAAAWVFVIRGQVSLAAGPGGVMKPGAMSTTTGEWELLRAPASKSPVTQLVVLAQGGAAEFIIDGASVRQR